MFDLAVHCWRKLLLPRLLLPMLWVAFSTSLSEAATSVTLGWDSPAVGLASFNLYYGPSSASYTNTITVPASTNTATVNNLVNNATYFFAVTAVGTNGLESAYSTELVFTNYLNSSPTLQTLVNLVVNQNCGPQTVALTNITSGASNENQPLTVTASSSNPGLVPNPTVNYTSPTSTGTLTFTPTANAYGLSLITVTVNDNQPANNTIARSFYVCVNAPPLISSIPNQYTIIGTPTPVIPIVVGDYETLADDLTLSATSSVPSLVPNSNIMFGGSDSNRTVIVTPAAGQSGSANITVFVDDGFIRRSATFTLAVTALRPDNTPPSIAYIPDQTTVPGTPVGPIYFAVSDAESPATGLTVAASSSNPTLVPVGNIEFSGVGTNRSLLVTPVAGLAGGADITVTVSDGDLTAARSFHLEVTSGANALVTITSTGDGTVTPNLTGPLVAGQSYTVTATPGHGNKFGGWRGSIVSSSPTLTFVAQSGMVLQANFLGPITPRAATFNGLFHEDTVKQNTAGAFSLKATPKGTYSGKLQMGATRLPFTGAFDTYGQSTNSVARKGGSALTLRLTVSQDQEKIEGDVTDGTWSALLSADRVVFSMRTNPAPWAGNYTLVVPGTNGQPNLPAGHSVATAKVNASGLAVVGGTLADGTRFTRSSYIARDGSYPLYAGLYTGQGSVISWLAFTNSTAQDIDGALCWIKPRTPTGRYLDGFSYASDAVGSRFQPAPKNTAPILPATTVYFDGGNLPAGFENSISVAANNKVTNLSSNRLTLAFSSANGSFKGSVVNPATGKPQPYNGVVLQKMNAGYGMLLGTNQSAGVIVSP